MVSEIIGLGQENNSGLIIDTSTESFMSDVIETSKEVPVLVDFWAPWCGPCKQLGPILEKIVSSAGGNIKLAKLNIDEHPQIAQQLQIQSIPAVFAFKDGQPFDAFVGAQSETQVKEFIEKIIGSIGPSPIDNALKSADSEFEKNDFSAAANLYLQVLNADPKNIHALTGLARTYLAEKNIDQAKEVLDNIPLENSNSEKVIAVKSALNLLEKAENTDDIDELIAALEKKPGDLEILYNIAMASIGDNNHEQAINYLLEIIKTQKDWNNGKARENLLKIFESLGPTNELTIQGRRQLSAIIFS